MKYFVFVLMIVLAVNGFAQVPLFGVQRSEGYKCPVQSMTNTDTTITSSILYYDDAKIHTGAASLVGSLKLTVGADTLTTFYMRQVMHRNPTNSTTLFDSTDWRKIKSQTGDYIPAENDVGATAIPISINLANQPFWMPGIGIQVQARIPSGAVRTKELELYIVNTKESN